MGKIQREVKILETVDTLKALDNDIDNMVIAFYVQWKHRTEDVERYSRLYDDDPSPYFRQEKEKAQAAVDSLMWLIRSLPWTSPFMVRLAWHITH